MGKTRKAKRPITKTDVLAWLRAKVKEDRDRADAAEEEAQAMIGDAEELAQILDTISAFLG